MKYIIMIIIMLFMMGCGHKSNDDLLGDDLGIGCLEYGDE